MTTKIKALNVTILVLGFILVACEGGDGSQGDLLSNSDANIGSEEVYAAKKDCASDRRVDFPATMLNISALSSRKAQFQVSKPSDASGYVTYSLVLAKLVNGSKVMNYTQNWEDRFFSLEGILDGLESSSTYEVSARTFDRCGNQAYSSAIRLFTPADGSDSSGPTLTGLRAVVMTSGSNSYVALAVNAKDETGMKKIEVSVDGVAVGSGGFGCGDCTNNLGNPIHMYRPQDPGALFYVTPLTSFGSHFYEVKATDALGNQTIWSGQVTAENGSIFY